MQRRNAATSNGATMQRRNAATMERRNHPTAQRRNSATTQRCNDAVPQRRNAATTQRHNGTTAQRRNDATMQIFGRQPRQLSAQRMRKRCDPDSGVCKINARRENNFRTRMFAPPFPNINVKT